MGLPGSGKTTLAKQLAAAIHAIHFNADRVRATVNSDLGFSLEDRITQARRMGQMAQFVSDSHHVAICDFVCPTPETRAAFKPDFIIWMNTISESKYSDTNALFVPPENCDMVLSSWNYRLADILEQIMRKDMEL